MSRKKENPLSKLEWNIKNKKTPLRSEKPEYSITDSYKWIQMFHFKLLELYNPELIMQIKNSQWLWRMSSIFPTKPFDQDCGNEIFQIHSRALIRSEFTQQNVTNQSLIIEAFQREFSSGKSQRRNIFLMIVRLNAIACKERTSSHLSCLCFYSTRNSARIIQLRPHFVEEGMLISKL